MLKVPNVEKVYSHMDRENRNKSGANEGDYSSGFGLNFKNIF